VAIEKRNIFLRETQNALPYISGIKRSGVSFPKRDDPRAHASYISRKLNECRQQDLTQKQVAAIRHKEGTYLEFTGVEHHDLCTQEFDNYP